MSSARNCKTTRCRRYSSAGARPSALLWASALGGAALVLAADISVRLVLPEKDLKLGVVMAIIGAPLFLHLVARYRGAQP